MGPVTTPAAASVPVVPQRPGQLGPIRPLARFHLRVPAGDAGTILAGVGFNCGSLPFQSQGALASFAGPAPLFLINGNVRGVGNGLLADVVALIVSGRRFPVMSYTNDKEELRKKITTLTVEGERLVLLDNLSGAVGNEVLDMALTTDTWKDRLLAGNRVYNVPLNVTWFGTGNNVQLAADTARRVCHVRMESADERPELKEGFRYPLPANPVVVQKDDVPHVRLKDRGKAVLYPLTEDGKRYLKPDRKYAADVRHANGKRKRVRFSSNQDASALMLADLLKSIENEKLGIRDPFSASS